MVSAKAEYTATLTLSSERFSDFTETELSCLELGLNECQQCLNIFPLSADEKHVLNYHLSNILYHHYFAC